MTLDLIKTLLISAVLALGLVAFDDNNWEDAGDNIGNAVDDIADGIDDACDEATSGNC